LKQEGKRLGITMQVFRIRATRGRAQEKECERSWKDAHTKLHDFLVESADEAPTESPKTGPTRKHFIWGNLQLDATLYDATIHPGGNPSIMR
jgi:hypothetical protein